VLVALGACGVFSPPSTRFARTTMHVPLAPQAALTRMKLDAAARGWRVADEGVDSIVVDFGVAAARVPVAEDDGLFGTRTTERDTEIHATALFRFESEPPGASVTMWNDPVYWHPDLRVWLPATAGPAPGEVLLRALASERVDGGATSLGRAAAEGASR
jgi:hypothetical protein